MPDGSMMNPPLRLKAMRLCVFTADASAERIERGIEAVRALFERAGVTLDLCALAAFQAFSRGRICGTANRPHRSKLIDT